VAVVLTVYQAVLVVVVVVVIAGSSISSCNVNMSCSSYTAKSYVGAWLHFYARQQNCYSAS